MKTTLLKAIRVPVAAAFALLALLSFAGTAHAGEQLTMKEMITELSNIAQRSQTHNEEAQAWLDECSVLATASESVLALYTIAKAVGDYDRIRKLESFMGMFPKVWADFIKRGHKLAEDHRWSNEPQRKKYVR